MDPVQEGVYDSFRVLRNCIASSSGIASNLLLCDELLKARQMVRNRPATTTLSLNLCRASHKGRVLQMAKDRWQPHRSSNTLLPLSVGTGMYRQPREISLYALEMMSMFDFRSHFNAIKNEMLGFSSA